MKKVCFNKNTTATICICTCIFVLMFVLNYLTPFLVDDFNYHYSFADFSRIESMADIWTSMKAHAVTVNGRIVAHSLMQFSTLFPKEVFDVANALVFLGMLMLMAKIADIEGQQVHADLLLVIFCAVWLFVRDFGQTSLWQDGSFNYLWGVLFNLFFLLQFIEHCIHSKVVPALSKRIVFVVYAFVAGAYSESASLACIIMAGLLLAYGWFWKKKKPAPFLFLAISSAMLGYLSIYLSPAQWSNKSTAINLPNLLVNFSVITTEYRSFTPLLIAFVILMTLMFLEKVDIDAVCLSSIFFVGSLVSMYILTFSKFFVGRAAMGACIFLIVADSIAISALLRNNNWKKQILCTLSVLVLLTIPALIEGGVDIIQTYSQVKHNEMYIISCAEQGVMTVEVPYINSPDTPYSAAYGLKYLDTEDPTSYPNNAMARYYGVESIIGK